MHNMFYVRTARALCPPTALGRSLPVHTACTAITPRPLTPHRACPPFDSAGELGPAHLVGVGKLHLAYTSPSSAFNQLGLHLCWLWLELGLSERVGFGKLRLKDRPLALLLCAPRREPAPYFVGPCCVFYVFVLCLCVLSSRCLVCRPPIVCVAVLAPLRR